MTSHQELSVPVLQRLGKELVLAARRSKRRRLALRSLAVTTGCTAGLLAGVVLLPVSDGDVGAPPAVALERNGARVTVKLTAPADPEVIAEALERAGVKADVRSLPVSPSLVGKWDTETQGAEVSPERSEVAFAAKVAPVLYVGRAAAPGEAYAVSAGAFVPGEALHCTGVESLPPSRIKARVRELGYELQWRYEEISPGNGGSGLGGQVEEPPEGSILIHATAWSDRVIIAFLAPATGPFRQTPAIPPQDCE